MAKIPTPRSRNQILGDMVTAFLSRFGLKRLKTGGPVLSMLEAAAQSDLRSSQDVFDLLNAQSLERAAGVALDRIGADEDLTRKAETPASGLVTVSDSRYKKIASKVYQGKAAPIVGSALLYVTDATSFPTSGSVYIGRGTSNYEGPLAYSSKTFTGSYWTLALTDNTRKFHNLGETVTVAQGGNRTISAGAVVQTPQGNSTDAVKFAVRFSATIPDGEIEISGVQVVAQKPGVASNVSAGAISSFVTPPFTGASVTNPLPFTNGQATEDDEAFRERIRDVRQSRSKGIPLSLVTAVQGITAKDENKSVSSASIVASEGRPTTVYIDDGTGYEERASGIALETLMDSASGGEQFFQVSAPKPVAKAYLVTTNSAPFKLRNASTLAVKVGGVDYEHTFDSASFRNIENATAYEIVASVNSDHTVAFSAATVDSGKRVRLFAKNDTTEDLEINLPAGLDANDDLLFAAGRHDTMRLYKNDRLLSKDGKVAAITSNPVAQWSALASGETLTIAIDGTPAVTYTFTDQDFVDAQTGYTTVGLNSIEAWIKVFHLRVPGITASDASGQLVITSNAGRSSRSKLTISSCSLVTKRMFNLAAVQGADLDYTLDRNTGQLRLEQPLALGDRLSAGTEQTRAFIESDSFPAITFASDANLWFVVDGAAKLIPSGVTAGMLFDVANVDASPAQLWGSRVRFTAQSGGTPFINVQAGDWVIITDTGVLLANRGQWRVAAATGTYFEVERSTYSGQTGSSLTSPDGILFVRTAEQLQKVTITAGTYTAANLTSAISIKGATPEVYQTSRLRIRTNTFGDNGDIALVAADTEGKKLGLPVASAILNIASHLAAVETTNHEAGTPSFKATRITTPINNSTFTANNALGFGVGSHLVFVKSLPDANRPRWGTNAGFRTMVDHVANGGMDVFTRSPAMMEFVIDDLFYGAAPWALGPNDDLVVVVDGDETTKRFQIPMYRKLTTTSNNYGASNTFKDAQISPVATLVNSFGQAFDFTDFAVFMAARGKTHSSDSTKSILWRYKRLGAEGEKANVSYVYPSGPSQPVSVIVDPFTDGNVYVKIALPSGAARAGYHIHDTTNFGLHASAAGSVYALTYMAGFSVSNAVRVTKLDFTNPLNGGFSNGNVVIGATSGASGTVSAVSGSTLTLTGVTGSYQNGEVLNVGGVQHGNASGTQYQVVTLTLTLPSAAPGATNAPTSHGLTNGSTVYLNSSSGTFTTGSKTITASTTTTISYSEIGTDGTATNIGTVSNDITTADFLGGAVAVGDIVNISAASGLNSNYEGITFRIVAMGNQYIQGYVPTFSGSVAAAPIWSPLTAASALRIYPLSGNSANSIVAGVNALDSKCPVKATVIGTGTGLIDTASAEDSTAVQLSDGINWIRSVTYPVLPTDDYSFTFKGPVSAGLATNSDWTNEDVRIAPTNALTLARWLGAQAVSGLSSACSIDISSEASRVQIASLTAGSKGSVQVQGGSANSGAAAVAGSAALASGGYMVSSLPAADADTFMGDMWVSADNTEMMPKSGVFLSTTTLTSFASDGKVIVTTNPLWTYSNGGTITNKQWRVEKQGRFISYTYYISSFGAGPTLGSASEGNWVWVSNANGARTMHGLNTGAFRVVRTFEDSRVLKFWIENPNAVEQDATCDVSMFTSDSMMPGDTFSLSTPIWGADNMGDWKITSVGESTPGVPFGNQFTFKVDITNRIPTAFGGGIALGSAAPLAKCIEGQPARFIKQIHSISPNQTDGTFLDVKFESNAGYEQIGETAGTIISPLDRLAFPTVIAEGIDGYQYNTGLIGEAVRVLYGDQRDPATYPGTVAAGARINVSGPIVKRIQIALNLRIRSGVSASDVRDRVKSAVASVVNQTGIGDAIAISDIVAAASKVNGVIAVSVLSPSYSVSSDLIPVQPQEKPLVMNLETDVTISFTGE